MEKTCCRCECAKSFDLFSRDRSTKDGFHPACKQCRKEIKRKSYLKNKSKIIAKQYEKRKKIQEWISQFRKECAKCGERHPACLDFHHEGKKEMGIAKMVNTKNWSPKMRESVLREIRKCVVLCSNCHRKWHWEERRSLSRSVSVEVHR